MVVTLPARSIAGTFYKNKFKSSETPTSTVTVSVNYSVYSRLNADRTRKVFRSRRNISSDGASRSPIDADRLFNAHFQSFVAP